MNNTKLAICGILGLGGAQLGALTVQNPEFPYLPTNYDEPYRGQFHFSPQGGWMNDVTEKGARAMLACSADRLPSRVAMVLMHHKQGGIGLPLRGMIPSFSGS